MNKNEIRNLVEILFNYIIFFYYLNKLKYNNNCYNLVYGILIIFSFVWV